MCKQIMNCFNIIIFEYMRMQDSLCKYPCTFRYSRGKKPGAALRQKIIGMTMVTAGKFHDFRTVRKPSCKADCTH